VPGKAIGATVDAVGTALIGVCLGAVGYVILGHLGNATVAQGIIMVIIVYGFALAKAKSLRWFGLSLLGIVVRNSMQFVRSLLSSIQVAFQGIYGSLGQCDVRSVYGRNLLGSRSVRNCLLCDVPQG
jgi:hypothetical protein